MSEDGRKRLRVLASSSTPTPQEKKDKTILPEVLPDPRRRRDPHNAPRGRTLAHMQRLLAAAAAVGVASVSCHKEKVTTEEGERRGCNPLGKKDSNTSSSSGYAVVDPVPTPAFCPGLAPLINGRATFSQSDGATWADVTLSLAAGREDFKYVKDAPVVAYSATVVTSEITAEGAKVTVKLDPGAAVSATSFSLSLKGNCNQGPATISVMVQWEGAITPATVPKVYLSEY